MHLNASEKDTPMKRQKHSDVETMSLPIYKTMNKELQKYAKQIEDA
jgi:hypothetical protein